MKFMATMALTRSHAAFAWVWGAVAALLIAAFAWSHRQVVPAEDAVILYEYAKNLAQTAMITYGGSVTPIEGATDFLWMVVIAALNRVGVDEYMAALLLNGAAAATLLLMTPGNRGRLLALIGLLCTPYLYASVAGFSALFFALGFVLLIAHRGASAPRFYLLTLLLCLVRPDGVVWCAAAICLRLFGEQGPVLRRDASAEWRAAFWWWVLPGCVYFCARWAYFGEFLPLPFYVKAGGHRDWLLFFPESVRDVWLALFPVLVTVLAWRRTRPAWWHLLMLVVLPAAFYSAVRLEQNIGNRFLAPMYFGVAFWLAQQKDLRTSAIFVLLSISMSWNVTKQTLADVIRSPSENVLSIAKSLAPFKGRMLTTEAGRLTYYSGWDVHDSWGLNTPKFAVRPLASADLDEVNYDLIVGHCDIGLYQAAHAWTVEPSKSWDMQCRTMANRLMRGDYTLFLVPFTREDSLQVQRRVRRAERLVPDLSGACKRHDVYAVREGFVHSTDVKAVLLSRGAIPLSSLNARVERDLVCSSSPIRP